MALHAIEVAQLQIGVAHEPVIGDQDARDRAQRPAVEAEPGEDVHVLVRQQVPGLDDDAEDARDQPAGSEADQLGDHVGEVVGGADDVGRHVDRERSDGQGEQREDDDQRVVAIGFHEIAGMDQEIPGSS